MSQIQFNPRTPSIIIDAEFEGRIRLYARLIFDTGASLVILPWRIAINLGLDVNTKNLVSTTTASAVETVPLAIIPRVTVLGKTVKNVECLIKDLPPESGVDGLLGLSFLRKFKITLDFKKGILTFE